MSEEKESLDDEDNLESLMDDEFEDSFVEEVFENKEVPMQKFFDDVSPSLEKIAVSLDDSGVERVFSSEDVVDNFKEDDGSFMYGARQDEEEKKYVSYSSVEDVPFMDLDNLGRDGVKKIGQSVETFSSIEVESEKLYERKREVKNMDFDSLRKKDVFGKSEIGYRV